MTSENEKFRPDLYVVSRIIKTLMEEGSLRKTRLSTFSGLSYDALIRYLSWMVSKDLLKEEDGFVNITENGIKTYNELVEWIINYVGSLKFRKQV